MSAQSAIGPIAFIGVGHMGSPMAARLIAQGFDVRIHDRDGDVAHAFVAAHGGTYTASLAEALREAAIAIAMLPDDAAVRAVMLGSGGVAEHLRAGGIAVDMGTSSPGSTRTIAEALALRQVAYVDAPVMGGVPFARDGTLDVMAGGDPVAIERCQPIFAALGRKLWLCGGSGNGHALKAVANFVNATTFITLIEGMVSGRKFGLDTQLLAEALAAMCGGRQFPLEKKVIPQVMTRKFATGMAIGLIAKDLGIAVGLAHEAGARASIAEQAHALWKEAAELAGPQADQATVALLWERAAGVALEGNPANDKP